MFVQNQVELSNCIIVHLASNKVKILLEAMLNKSKAEHQAGQKDQTIAKKNIFRIKKNIKSSAEDNIFLVAIAIIMIFL